MPPLFEVTFWSGCKVRFHAFDLIEARRIAREDYDDAVLRIVIV